MPCGVGGIGDVGVPSKTVGCCRCVVSETGGLVGVKVRLPGSCGGVVVFVVR